MIRQTIFLSFLSFLFFIQNVNAQCTNAPAEAGYNCSGANGIATNGQTINNGQTFWYTGTGTFTNQVIVEKGGTFIICGDLTLSGGINIKGDAGGQGIVMIKTGGALRITSSGTTSIDGRLYNYGVVTIANALTINASGSQFINATRTSQLVVNGPFSVNGSTNFVNFGDFISNSDFTSNAAASVCMGAESTGLIAGNWRNEGANTWTSPSGKSCINYVNAANSTLNQPLTLTNNLNICLNSSSGMVTNFGSAIYKTNCNNCFIALPIELASFKVKCLNTNQNLFGFEWSTLSEKNNDFFTVEYSLNGVDFNSLFRVKGAGNSTNINKYTTDAIEIELSPIVYFRLKQTDFNGLYSYSHIITSLPCLATNSIRFMKKETDGNNNLLVNLHTPTPVYLEVYDIIGHIIEKKNYEDLNIGENFISLQNLIPGTYILKVTIKNELYTIVIGLD